jgi:beta-lactamase superfamily II metal-dependent hydrolase
MYDGIEIDMLSLGNADSILVTRWSAGYAVRVLIDGGNKSDADTVLGFLRRRSITHLDHVVCSHPHDDHAGGLRDILSGISFGQFWMHIPSRHVNLAELRVSLILEATLKRSENVTRIITESLQTTADLETLIGRMGKIIQEPFAGMEIGPLTVCGPSVQFYEQQLADFKDFARLEAMERLLEARAGQVAEEDRGVVAESSLLGVGGTEPENNSATILGFAYNDDKFLLTSDAGVEALTAAKDAYQLMDLRWMQIPHHGSRRNISEALIEHFKPQTAYVSAIGGTKHPRRAVVNAFKARGCKVFSTHYPAPGGHKWFHLGTVPARTDYSSDAPLWD